MELFYRKPAEKWVEALPIGNGRLGAMVFGDPAREEIQLNEETFWDGCFDPEADNPETPDHLGEIREAIFSGDYARGEELTQRYMICRGAGSGYGHGLGIRYGSFQTAGSLRIAYRDPAAGEQIPADYRRSLDLMTGLAEAWGIKNAKVMWPVRIAAAGKAVTPGGAVEICRILGKEETLRRLRIGLEKLL